MGSTATFDDGTSIIVSKGGVQFISSGVGPINGSEPLDNVRRPIPIRMDINCSGSRPTRPVRNPRLPLH